MTDIHIIKVYIQIQDKDTPIKLCKPHNFYEHNWPYSKCKLMSCTLKFGT